MKWVLLEKQKNASYERNVVATDLGNKVLVHIETILVNSDGTRSIATSTTTVENTTISGSEESGYELIPHYEL